MFPCLLLAYSGQAAYLMKHHDDVTEVFYRSIPGLFWSIPGWCILSREKQVASCHPLENTLKQKEKGQILSYQTIFGAFTQYKILLSLV